MVPVRDCFAARVWRERAAWLAAGIGELGAVCDRIWA